MRNIKKHMIYIKKMWSISIQLMMEYRFNFFMTTWTIGLWLVSYAVWVALLYQFTDAIQGYSEIQYMGFIGFYFFVINLFWFLFDVGMDDLSAAIYEGRLDFLVTKPVDSQFMLTFRGFYMPSLFNMLFGFFVIVYSLSKSEIEVTFVQIALVVIVILLAIISIYAIMFTALSITFWAGRLNALQRFLSKVIDEPATIPGTAYKGVVKAFFYFIIPVVLITTVPTSVIYWEVASTTILFYAVFALAALLVSRIVWKMGLRSYTSVSS